MNDQWRKRKDLFDNSEDYRPPPERRTGEEIKNLLDTWEECPRPGKKRKAPDALYGVWRRKIVFWSLE